MKLLSFPRLMTTRRLVIARLVLGLALSWLPRIAEAAPDLTASISALELQWAKVSYQSTGIDQDAALLFIAPGGVGDGAPPAQLVAMDCGVKDCGHGTGL